MNIVNLPTDIVYEITKYVSLQDISHLKMASFFLNEKINNVQNNIILDSMKIFDPKKHTNSNQTYSDYIIYLKQLFYGMINYYVSYQLSKYKKMYYKGYKQYKQYKQYHKCTIHHFKYYVLNFDKYYTLPYNYYISENYMINNIFNKIFKFYVLNNYTNIENYPNHLELFVLYNFIQIDTFQSTYNFEYMFNFLESINNSSYYDIKLKYYNYILNTIHTNNVPFTFNQMHTMSYCITSIPIIKKIFGYRVLDLSNSQLNLCCYDCNEANLYEICDFKKVFWKDELISHNYMQLKELLKRENHYYYTILINRENYIINDMIYIKNPITNRRVRLNGYRFYYLMKFFEDNMKTHYIKIINFIKRRQQDLRRKIFS
jgi:hypothetical protein